MKSPTRLLAILACASCCAACSSQQAYGAGQVMQRNECQKIIDTPDRQRCLANADRSHDSYQRQQDELKKTPRGE